MSQSILLTSRAHLYRTDFSRHLGEDGDSGVGGSIFSYSQLRGVELHCETGREKLRYRTVAKLSIPPTMVTPPFKCLFFREISFVFGQLQRFLMKIAIACMA